MSDLTRTPTRTSAGATSDVGARAREDLTHDSRQDETKPSFLTTEFWVMVGGIAALIVTYHLADDATFDLFRLCLLCTLAGMAYVVSRGLAKAGAARRHEERRAGRAYR
jgi:hypothetical protein